MRRRRRTTGATTTCPSSTSRYDMLQTFELMQQGKINGYICQGFNPLASAPNKAKMNAACEAEVPGHHGSARDRDVASSGATTASTTTSIRRRSRPKCSACPRPALPRKMARWSIPRAGCSGTGRAPIRRAKRAATSRSWPSSSCACAPCTQKDGGAYPDPIVKLTWPYAQSARARRPKSSPKEYSGKALKDLADPKDPTKIMRKAGEQLGGIRRTARRRQHRVRLLDLLRRLGPQPATSWRGATTPIRPASARRSTGRGRGRPIAASSTTARPAIRAASHGIRRASSSAGTARLERRRRSGLQGRRGSGRRHGPVHHESGRRGAILRPRRHGRRPVPRALRAVRDAAAATTP